MWVVQVSHGEEGVKNLFVWRGNKKIEIAAADSLVIICFMGVSWNFEKGTVALPELLVVSLACWSWGHPALLPEMLTASRAGSHCVLWRIGEQISRAVHQPAHCYCLAGSKCRRSAAKAGPGLECWALVGGECYLESSCWAHLVEGVLSAKWLWRINWVKPWEYLLYFTVNFITLWLLVSWTLAKEALDISAKSLVVS